MTAIPRNAALRSCHTKSALQCPTRKLTSVKQKKVERTRGVPLNLNLGVVTGVNFRWDTARLHGPVGNIAFFVLPGSLIWDAATRANWVDHSNGRGIKQSVCRTCQVRSENSTTNSQDAISQSVALFENSWRAIAHRSFALEACNFFHGIAKSD